MHDLLTKTVGKLATEMGGHDYHTFGYDFEVNMTCNSCNHKWTSRRTRRTVGANMVVLDVGINEDRQRNLFSNMVQDLSLMEKNIPDL